MSYANLMCVCRYKQASRRAGELETELNDKATVEANVMTENVDLKTKMTQLSVSCHVCVLILSFFQRNDCMCLPEMQILRVVEDALFGELCCVLVLLFCCENIHV